PAVAFVRLLRRVPALSKVSEFERDFVLYRHRQGHADERTIARRVLVLLWQRIARGDPCVADLRHESSAVATCLPVGSGSAGIDRDRVLLITVLCCCV